MKTGGCVYVSFWLYVGMGAFLRTSGSYNRDLNTSFVFQVLFVDNGKSQTFSG